MDALNPPPQPQPVAVPPQPESAPVASPPALPSGPVCSACTDPAVVHWLRRPTDDELDDAQRVERERRERSLLLADPQLPEPDFGPLPAADTVTVPVYACPAHAISLDAAARIHQSGCTAPNEADLPGCDCTPEQLPEPEPVHAFAPPTSPLPAHWLPGAE